MGALADIEGISAQNMLHIWQEANAVASSVHSYDDVQKWIAKVEKLADIQMPYAVILVEGMRTEGDLKRYVRKTEQNALYAAYAIIGRSMIEGSLLPEERIQRVFQKAYSLEDEIVSRRIKLKDIQQVLEDEFGLRLSSHLGKVELCLIEPEE